jgi:hypothetical protein
MPSQFDRAKWSRAAARQREPGNRVRIHNQARADYDQHRLIPARITMALDLRELYGPEVDAACDAAEPDVDRWEAGELYPTWRQVELLAKLTDFPVHFFFMPVGSRLSGGWLCTERTCEPLEQETPIVSWKPGAFTAAPTPVQGTLL